MKNGKNDFKKNIEEQIGEFKADNVTELIKMLHCEPDTELFYQDNQSIRDDMAFGVTKQDAAERLDVRERTIFNMIAQLDPKRRPENMEPYYIAGQPINLEICEKRIDNTRLKNIDSSINIDRRTRFYSKGSMHPIFLQLNVTQLGALFRALAVDYEEYKSRITLSIGAYIYAQLSDYARNRIIKVYAEQDEAIEEFMEKMEHLEKYDFENAFKKESEFALLEHESIDRDALTIYVKNEKKCDISIKIDGEIKEFHDVQIKYNEGFYITSNSGLSMDIIPENVLKIYPSEK